MARRRSTEARLIARLPGGGDGPAGAAEIRLYCPSLEGVPPAQAAVTALLPIHDSNGRLLEMLAGSPALGAGIYACVLAIDPFRRVADILRDLSAAGVTGVANFPTVAVIDGTMRETLDSLGMGFDREVALIRLAREAGLGTAGVATSETHACQIIAAGADMLVAPAGSREDAGIARAAEEGRRPLVYLRTGFG